MLDSILKRLLHPGKPQRKFPFEKKNCGTGGLPIYLTMTYSVRLSVLTITILIFSGCGVFGGFFDGCLAESFTLRQVRQLMQHTVFQ